MTDDWCSFIGCPVSAGGARGGGNVYEAGGGQREAGRGAAGLRDQAAVAMQSWFRACSPAARVLRSTPAVRHRSHRPRRRAGLAQAMCFSPDTLVHRRARV